jgi:hypothetical protein
VGVEVVESVVDSVDVVVIGVVGVEVMIEVTTAGSPPL